MIDAYAVTVRREIAAPAEALFDAWLDARSLGSWLKPSRWLDSRVETDPQVGGAFRIVMVNDESSMLHTGTYREIDRPRRLVFTWSSPSTQHRDSLVTVTFEPVSARSTVVEIHQVGLPDAEAQANHHRGWSEILAGLDRAVGHEPGAGA